MQMPIAVLRNAVATRQPAEAHSIRAAYRRDVIEPALTSRTAMRARTDDLQARPAVLRTVLVVGSVIAMIVAGFAASGVAQSVEPELVLLLRGMAAIKGLLAISAAGLLWWRLGTPVSSRAAVTYMASTWMLLASAVLIWHLAFILAAAFLFHAAGVVGLVVAMREGRLRTTGD